MTDVTIPSDPGTYALIMGGEKRAAIEVGRLGRLTLQGGWYVYVGSAFGPGGLAARIRHHARIAAHPRWHIDYLRRHVTLEEVWYTCDPARREHEWARRLAGPLGGVVPLSGFGSSDCGCGSHLTRFETRPACAAFARDLGGYRVSAAVVADEGDSGFVSLER